MRLAVVFWFQDQFEVCAERAALLRKMNPGVPIFGLYSGAVERAREARAALGDAFDDLYVFTPKQAYTREVESDQLLALWMRERGRRFAWDSVLLHRSDLLLASPLSELLADLAPGEAVLSGFRPLADVKSWWGWADGRDPGKEALLQAFTRRLSEEHAYGGPLWCCLFVLVCLPREFLERYAAEASAREGWAEYRLPTYAHLWRTPVRTDLGLRPWWAADPSTRDAPPRERLLNAAAWPAAPDMILEELQRPDGVRAFCPYTGTLTSELAAVLAERLAASTGSGDPENRAVIPQAAPAETVKVAVLLRTHVDNEQVRRSANLLSRGGNYDFYLLAHEEAGGSLDFGDIRKISHSLQDFRDLGFTVDSAYFLMHCADLLFEHVRERLPEYDYYVLVENDVYIRDNDPPYFERVVENLSGLNETVDLIVTRLGESDPVWIWHAAVQQAYPKVYTSFFPLVIVSNRGVSRLFEERLKERERAQAQGVKLSGGPGADNIMFCEAFIASALIAGDYNVLDLNELMPGSYARESFNTGPPRLLTEQGPQGSPDLLHPVLDDREFLEKQLNYSWRTRSLPLLLEQLRSGEWTISDALRAEFTRRTEERMKEPEAPAWAK